MPSDEGEGEEQQRRHTQGGEDAEQADWLAVDFEEGVRYDHTAGRWHIFNGIRWAPDQTREVQRRAIDYARARITAVALASDIGDDQRTSLIKTYRRLFEMARVESSLKALALRTEYKTDGADWDQDPNLLGCENGVIDLRINALVESTPETRVSKTTGHKFKPMTGWDEAQDRAPKFWQSMLEWTSNDVELAVFYLLWFGYSLFGHTQEQRFLILTGLGRNGKGALVTAMRHVFGEYSADADSSVYMRTRFGAPRSDGARADLMALKGKRLAVMSEPDGGAFNEELLKAHTGGDPITARALHSNNVISWVPTHTITFLTNNPPSVNDIGPAMAARVMVADFRERFEGDHENKKLYAELEKEAEGILAILAFAAMTWFEAENGLSLPARVVKASNEYLTSNDPIGQALHDAFVIERGVSAQGKVLYDAYVDWFKRSGQDNEPLSMTAFGLALSRKGMKRIKRSSAYIWQDIRPMNAFEVAATDEG